jgi:hypothetical protein
MGFTFWCWSCWGLPPGGPTSRSLLPIVIQRYLRYRLIRHRRYEIQIRIAMNHNDICDLTKTANGSSYAKHNYGVFVFDSDGLSSEAICHARA